jgi:hypothetical protein
MFVVQVLVGSGSVISVDRCREPTENIESYGEDLGSEMQVMSWLVAIVLQRESWYGSMFQYQKSDQ